MSTSMDNIEDFNRARNSGPRRPDAAPRPGAAALWVDDAAWSEAEIPPRPWVARGYLLRGAVTIAAGPGGAGKSSLLCAWSVSLATGEPHGRFAPLAAMTVLTYAIEDDRDELRRRLSATLRQFGRGPEDLAKRLIRCGPKSVGTLIERDPVTGTIVLTEAWDSLEALIAERRPDVVELDPFAELHTADETDNTALRQVVARLRELAQQYDCAIVLVHHTRKGAVAGDVDAIRGASAIVGAVRIALTVTPMTEEEAEELGQSKALRRSYFRVDLVKQNYAPASDAAWHVMHEYQLDNDEAVAAAIPWTPPPRQNGIEPETLEAIAAEVARGAEDGPYSPRLSTDQPRSVAAAMVRCGVADLPRQKAALQALIEQGFVVGEFRDQYRRARTGLRSPQGHPRAAWISKAPRQATLPSVAE